MRFGKSLLFGMCSSNYTVVWSVDVMILHTKFKIVILHTTDSDKLGFEPEWDFRKHLPEFGR